MRKLLLVAAIAAALGVLHVGAAQAVPPPCGTVTQNTTLSADCFGPMVIGTNGITVDLNGHSIICAGGDGVTMNSKSGVTIKNGQITGCSFGIDAVLSDGNQFVSLFFETNTFGVALGTGSDSNLLRLSRFQGNTLGVAVVGSSNTIRRNQFSINTIAIQIGGFGETVSENRINNAALGVQLTPGSENTTVFLNSILGVPFGIQVEDGSHENQLRANAVFGGINDMADLNPNCDSNVWFINAFGSRNQNCIR
jgi:nitrous oxidase accessory protein NosD